MVDNLSNFEDNFVALCVFFSNACYLNILAVHTV